MDDKANSADVKTNTFVNAVTIHPSAHFSPTSEERGADVIERCTHAR